MKLKTGQKEVPTAEKGCCLRTAMPATHRTVHCNQRSEFSLTFRLCLRLSQRQDKVGYGRLLFLSSFWIKAPSKRSRRSIVLEFSFPERPPKYFWYFFFTYVRYSNAQARQEMRKLRSTESVINHYLDWCPVTLLDMK